MNNTIRTQEENINLIIDCLKELKMPALNQLNQMIKAEFGLNDINFSSSSNDKEDKKEEKKTSYSLVLTSVGDQRIPVFNAIKEITGKSILEVKKLTDTLPFVILSDLNQQKAEEFKENLVSKGAGVEIK